MCSAGRAHQPARCATVKLRLSFERHDEIDLAIGVRVMRSGDVFHVHNVDRKTVQLGASSENATVLDAATFAVAQPTLGNPGFAGLFERLVGLGRRAMFGIEPRV